MGGKQEAEKISRPEAGAEKKAGTAAEMKAGAAAEELTLNATIANIPKVTDFVNERLEAFGCPMKIQVQIDIAIDELFGNIANYAYSPEVGPVTVRVELAKEKTELILTFTDSGVPFDPLQQKAPDTVLSLEERQAGGLGIFIVKKSMDALSYEYRDGKNILKVTKKIS